MSPSLEFKHAITAQQAGIDGLGGLRVTKWHNDWVSKPESEQRPTKRALEHAAAVLAGDMKRPRSARISASSLGDPCTRRVMFGFYGAPTVPDAPQSRDLMDMGHWLHLKWQVEGLSAGWLTEAETFFHSEDLRVGGSTDGIMLGDELFELKTVGEWVYKRVQKLGQPKHEHTLQVEGYFLLSGMKRASIVYVDRATGAMTEFRYESRPDRRAELHAILADLHDWLDLDTLPAMLEDCESRDGYTYRRCPYREFCPGAEKVGLALRGGPRLLEAGSGLPGSRDGSGAEAEGLDASSAAARDGGLVRGPGTA